MRVLVAWPPDIEAVASGTQEFLAQFIVSCDNAEMLSFIKRLLGPTRFDACCVVIATHWVAVVVLMTVAPLQMPTIHGHAWLACVNVVAAATWIAIAASYCWKGYSVNRCRLLLASSIASVVFSQAWYWLNPQLTQISSGAQEPEAGFKIFAKAGTVLQQCEFVILLVLLTFGVLWLGFLFRFVTGKLSRFFGSSTASDPADRTKGLVITAGVLFLVSVIYRLQSSLGIGLSREQFDFTEFGLAAVLALLIWLVALIWFPKSWSTSGKPVQKSLSFVLVLAGLVFAAFAWRSIPLAFVMAMVIPCFIATVIGIAVCPVEVEEAQGRRVIKPAFRPSLTSLATVLMLCLASSVPLLVGTGPLAVAFYSMNRMGSAPQVWELAELAMSSAIAQWKSGGRAKFEFDSEHFAPTWTVTFDDAAPADLLASLPTSGIFAVELDGMTPEFDASLVPAGLLVCLKDCRVTHTQLEQILASIPSIGISGSLSIVDDGHQIDPGTISTVWVRDADPGAAKKFLDATSCCSQLTRLVFSSPLSSEDWPAVEDASQHAQVWIQGGWAPEFKLPKMRKSLGTVYCTNSHGLNSDLEKDLLLNTDVNLFPVNLNLEDASNAWKMAMLRGATGHQNFEYQFIKQSELSIDEFAKQIGMAYEVEDDIIRSLYFPSNVGPGQIAELQDLRVLSFDPGWVKPGANIASFGAVGTPQALNHLYSLTSLEELYFGALVVPRDLAILSKLTSLKHLQIASVVRSVTGPSGFDDCPTLESITFFGVPDNRSWNEVSRLPNLKRLTVVDHESDETLTPEFLAKVKKRFPGVEVSFLDVHDNETLVPEAFREYRDRLRKELRSDTKWLDVLLKDK